MSEKNNKITPPVESNPVAPIWFAFVVIIVLQFAVLILMNKHMAVIEEMCQQIINNNR